MSARPIAELPNLGPKMVEWLAAVGIHDESDLRRFGPVDAFLRLRARDPRVGLNALYAMDAALDGVHWLAVTPERKQALRAAATFAAEDL